MAAIQAELPNLSPDNFGGNRNSGGIPEEYGGFRRNLQESGSNAGIYRNLCKIPVNKAKNRNFITPAKTRFL
jgi:hypothetical protein